MKQIILILFLLETFEIKLLASSYITKDLNGDSYSRYYYGNAIDALIYNPVNNIGVWNPYYFPKRSLEYLRLKIYENNPVYALFISNSFIPSSNSERSDVVLSNDKSKIFSVDYDNGLRLIDISDLNTPVLTDIMQGRMELITISADNKHLFIKSRGVEEYFLKIIDISDILNPIELSSTSVPDFNNMQLSKDETKLYVTSSDYDTNALGVIDISDLTQPVVGTEINTIGVATDLILSEDEQTAYMTDARGGLQIIDISNSNEFKLLSTYITKGLVEKVLLSNDGTKVYLTIKYPVDDAYTQRGHIEVIDITDKNNPSLFAEHDLNSVPLSAFIFTSDETKMITSDSYNGQKERIYENVGYFQDITLLGETANNYNQPAYKLFLMQSETVMLSISFYQINIIDISDPANPTVIKTVELNFGEM